ncbi:acyl-CoA thioesterase [bacterium]|nr:acyl-CoA thioesterase [Akkermansiaceae bacterium]MDB4306448.1 acyl-CoA thioesterase [bacterium]MDB0068721.1 acyl-CoA thioesterase [Akkermansiaceae bacterium]MDB4144059.1 acyl-CoA thioesterase [Akkermansiaceae bacterium]MDB4265832.1 acyl-CoA thioesterase [Akkermansiaceae bacterium]
METHRLVLPGDLNQFGYLFGGQLLGWIDEASWIAASLDFPRCRFVTIGMDQVVFRHSVREGTILIIDSKKVTQGETSVTYQVEVRRGRPDEKGPIFSTKVTFVNVDEAGEKKPLL